MGNLAGARSELVWNGSREETEMEMRVCRQRNEMRKARFRAISSESNMQNISVGRELRLEISKQAQEIRKKNSKETVTVSQGGEIEGLVWEEGVNGSKTP